MRQNKRNGTILQVHHKKYLTGKAPWSIHLSFVKLCVKGAMLRSMEKFDQDQAGSMWRR